MWGIFDGFFKYLPTYLHNINLLYLPTYLIFRKRDFFYYYYKLRLLLKFQFQLNLNLRWDNFIKLTTVVQIPLLTVNTRSSKTPQLKSPKKRYKIDIKTHCYTINLWRVASHHSVYRGTPWRVHVSNLIILSLATRAWKKQFAPF